MRRFAHLLCALALLALCAAPALAGSAIDLGTLKGVSYSPTPSDYTPGAWKYEDSDFYTSDFKALWGSSGGVGREDLKHISQDLHANFVRLYDWNPGNDHGEFLDTAASYGVKVAIPISNWFLQQYQNGHEGQVQEWVHHIVDEAYAHRAGVLMFSVGNEPELNGINASTVAAIMQYIVEEEIALGKGSDMLPMTSPVSFAVGDDPQHRPAIAELTKIKDAINANSYLKSKNAYQDLYVGSVNCFNPGSDITSFISTYAAAFPGSKLLFTELGRSDSETSDQAAFVKAQAQAALAGGVSLGCAIFNYQDQSWKGGAEAHYGLNTVTAGTKQISYGRGTYPLDTYTHKASFEAIAQVYSQH